jgi:hypothetical protein
MRREFNALPDKMYTGFFFLSGPDAPTADSAQNIVETSVLRPMFPMLLQHQTLLR